MKKIIPIFFVIILGFAAFLYFRMADPDANKSPVNNESEEKEEKIASLREDYRQNVKNIFNDYTNNIDDLQKVSSLKSKLLELKVPTELMALHLNLVLAMGKTESYIQNGEEDDKIASEKTIKETREKYPWIN